MSRCSRWLVLLTLAIFLAGLSGTQAQGAKKLEIFSWWTAGGEADGLNAMFQIYKKQNPGVEIINATVAGGAGTNAKAVLKTRMQGGDPPDSFQVHGGAELTDTWVKTGFMEPITSLWKSEGWMARFPKDLIDIVSYQGEIYSVPVNVHRGNVLWYNKKIFDDHRLKAPKTWEEFFTVADALKARGITPLSLGDKNKWEAAHLFEDILLASLGAEGYRGLWTGKTPWTGDGVKKALEAYARILGYVNADHAAGTWDSAAQMLIDRKAAMNIMGDWAAGYFTSKGWKAGADYGWAPAPGTAGVFVVVTDTFGLPKKAPHRAEALAWLTVAGSKEGQEAFNPLKGSICARTDCDLKKFDAYLQSSAADFVKNALVPSEVHGSAAPEGFATQFNDIVNLFVTNKNVAAAQRALQQACVANKMCK
ncbi:MAG: ABC transporter substrate-binding protein [Armatimonadota bacterium]|nr:ABC transporter substrate-binding protein [Armatimonadota bacterium]MDR7519921.1 ABC transporter substrate-binding protein [Armatimonadota bacterium]MDR7548499.1 ABC transporter substrate-binding protein [Armatimonadota bacterium]